MSRAVLISIRPKWCELIASLDKTIEVRKTRPKIETPFKCYMYMSAYHWAFSLLRQYGMDDLAYRLMHETGKVIGEFVCDKVFPITVEENGQFSEERGGGYSEDYSTKGFQDCLTDEEFDAYLSGKPGYGWHISNLVIYDEPKKLSEFYRWYDGATDIRPCENGKPCDHLIFDYSEDHEACGIDYDGENCPFLKVSRPPESYCYVEELT